jgi:hypothetical protein
MLSPGYPRLGGLYVPWSGRGSGFGCGGVGVGFRSLAMLVTLSDLERPVTARGA